MREIRGLFERFRTRRKSPEESPAVEIRSVLEFGRHVSPTDENWSDLFSDAGLGVDSFICADTHGVPYRFSDREHAHTGLVSRSAPERKGDRLVPVGWIKYLDHIADLRWKDDVARFLVEASRLWIGGEADDQGCAVFTRPGVGEDLDLQSDAFAPVLGHHRDPVDECYFPSEELCAVYLPHEPSYGGILGVGTHAGAPCKFVASPRPYQHRPQTVIALSEDLWARTASGWVGDLFAEQSPDLICLDLVANLSDYERNILTSPEPIEESHKEIIP